MSRHSDGLEVCVCVFFTVAVLFCSPSVIDTGGSDLQMVPPTPPRLDDVVHL